MAAATTPLIRAFECSIPSASTAVKASSSYPFVLFRSAPVNVTHILRLSPPSSSSIPSWVSPKPRISPSIVVPLVAQTADWAQQEQEDEDSVNELDWGEKAVNGMEAGAGLSWEEDKGGEDAGEGSLFHGVLDVGSKGPPNSTPPKAARLFVRNLTPDIDGENLAQLFDQAGVVETAEVIYSRETDQSRGFGFVTMSTVEEAEKAMEMFHRYDLKGQLLLVNIAAPRGSRPRPPGSIYVVNLSWQVDSDRLRQVFSQHGKVINARVISDRETGRSRGYGFVTMSTQTEMNEAIAALNGQSLDGRELKMKVTEKRPRRTSL